MKIFPLLLCGILATSALAQPAPQSGYQMLVAAGKLILPGENGNPSTTELNLSPQENLRRQRLAVARNAPALKLLREALRQPFDVPTMENSDGERFSESVAFRELSRQLRQESDVRLADGDTAGALDSRLTAIELGVALTIRAPLIGSLIGNSIEAMARKDFAPIGTKLDAATIRAALERLKALDAGRPTYSEILQVEKAIALRMAPLQYEEFFFGSAAAKKRLATPEGRKEAGMSEAEAREMIALTPQTLAAQLTQMFDAAIARDQLPYPSAIQIMVPPMPSRFIDALIGLWRDPQSRFVVERNITENRLLQAALELRAIKLESGAYPATFAAPFDPFSDHQPLIYKRDGDGYQLYSIGPDAKDDNATPIQTIVTNRETGAKTVSGWLAPDSRGDIVAPVF